MIKRIMMFFVIIFGILAINTIVAYAESDDSINEQEISSLTQLMENRELDKLINYDENGIRRK